METSAETVARIARFVARIQLDRETERSLNPFTQRAQRDAIQANITRNVAELERICSAHAKRESAAAGYPCAPVQGVKIGAGWDR